jgi:hypothetical protein
MAGRKIRCECGCAFIVPETRRTVNCPACGEELDCLPPAPAVAAPPSPASLPAPGRPGPYWPLWILVGAGGVLAVLLIVLVAVLLKGPAKPPVAPTLAVDISTGEPPTSAPKPPSQKSAPLPDKPAPAAEPFDPAATLGLVQRLTARNNMAAIVATALLRSGQSQAFAELHAALDATEREIKAASRKLSGLREAGDIPPRFEPGDELLAFGPAPLDPRNPAPFVEELRTWLRLFQPGLMVLSTVQRGSRTHTIPMYFMERTPEMVELAARAGVVLGPPSPAEAAEIRRAAPSFGAAGPAESGAFPADLVDEVRRRTAAIHPHYRKSLTEDEAQRLRRLLEAGRGTAEDLEFLRGRVLRDVCGRAEADYASLQSRLADLEAKLHDPGSTDTVVFADGRKVSGKIEEETPDAIRLKGRFGAVRIPRSEIQKIEKGGGALAEFRAQYLASRGKLVALLALLASAKEKKLDAQKELVCTAILVVDPGHETAWKEIGGGEGASRALGEPGAADGDVVRLKNGTSRTGIIIAETDASVTLETFVRGAKGETLGMAKMTVPKAEITRIDRMSEEGRARARERSRSFEDRKRRHAAALAQVRVEPSTLQGVACRRTTGYHFELLSTCGEEVVREATHTLNEMFEAYKKYFSIRRNGDRRIRVYLLSSRPQYEQFQQAIGANAGLAPAFFNIRENYIAAYNMVQSAEAEQIRQEILRAEASIQDWKKRIAAEEDRVERYVRALKQETLDRAAEARKGLTVEDSRNPQIDRWKEQRLNAIRSAERQANDQLAALRRQANEAIQACDRIILHNNNVLVAQARSMYETLFHEGFHAFAANYLWEEVDNRGIPRWLHEGMATYFQMSVVEAGELIHGGPNPALLKILKGNLQAGKFVPLDEVLRAGPEIYHVSHVGEVKESTTHYAHAWGLAHYLARRITREQLEAYVTDVVGGRDPVVAFERMLGRRWFDVQAEFRMHVESLK